MIFSYVNDLPSNACFKTDSRTVLLYLIESVLYNACAAGLRIWRLFGVANKDRSVDRMCTNLLFVFAHNSTLTLPSLAKFGWCIVVINDIWGGFDG